jgi:hypothetical protein
MWFLVGLYVVASLLYMYRLHKRLQGYEHIWSQLESIADRNQDGSFTVHVQHLEDAHPEYEAHAADTPSGIRLMDFGAKRNPNRAA